MSPKKTLLNNLILWVWFFVHTAFTQLPQAVIDLMASRHERYHHFLWHNIRNNWNFYSSETQAEIDARGWTPPRPALGIDSDGNPFAIIDNLSGEDFLYMHRQMIDRVRAVGGDIEELTGWTNIPSPGDSKWPVPSSYTVPDDPDTTSAIRTTKTNSFYRENIVPVEEMFNDPNQLRSMTLGELGSRIEFTIHNWMHTRFSALESYGYLPFSNSPFPYFDTRWDDPAYDWLGDFYSSQVNPTFWKLHGWIDDRIEAWRVANDLSTITWTGTWDGGPMSTLSDILEPRMATGTTIAIANISTISEDSDPSVRVSGFGVHVQVDLPRRTR